MGKYSPAVNGVAASCPFGVGQRLQAARLALPKLLAEKRSSLRDLGTRDNLRLVEIALDAPLTMTVEIDPATARIVRSIGKAKEIELATAYGDFRTVDGLLIAFHEENSAMGMKTAEIELRSAAAEPPLSKRR